MFVKTEIKYIRYITILLIISTTVSLAATVSNSLALGAAGSKIIFEDKPDGWIPTEEWAVRLVPGVSANEIAQQLEAENLGQIGTLPNTFLFHFSGLSGESDALTRISLDAHSSVEWYEQQFARQRYPRITISDTLYSDQWHLNNTGQTSGTVGIDANVVPVWDSGLLGTGIVIGIVDDGLQHSHLDLSPNYLASASYDFNDDDNDPAPSAGDGHGTSAAGVAAARDDGSVCGVGSAFRANLAGLRLIAAPNTDADEAAALNHQLNTIHVYNNSWGPNDDGQTLEAPGSLTQLALQQGTANGRNGLGNIYIWAAGNGLANDDNVNYDGYANSRFTIAVGAVDHNGIQSWYSEPGAAMLVTAPSSGAGVEITTTDLSGSDGSDPTDCRSDFGGTSSAAPLTSGVVALILEANPNLGWRDVQHILLRSVVQNDSGDADWVNNGAGYLVNHKYGFGMINAEAAVNAARNWANIPAAIFIASSTVVNQAIPDNNPTGIISTHTITDPLFLEHVEVIFDATHPYRGDLEVTLISPSGTESVLAEQHDDDGDNYSNWRFMTVRNWQESSVGTWTLRVVDLTASNTGTLNSWSLGLHGTELEIKDPVNSNPGYAGPHNNPSKIIIRTNKPTNNLTVDSFPVFIGGISANVVTVYEGSDEYVLEVLPPSQSANGLYDLSVAGIVEDDGILYADTNNVDVSLVIDRSGSMSFTEPGSATSYMEAAKQAATQFVDLMFDNDQLAVVSFDDIIETPHPMALVDVASRMTAKQAIAALDARDLTSIGGGLEEGQNQLTSSGVATHPWAIVLLTDGYENTSPMVADVLPAIAATKTIVHTVALGPSSDQDLLLDIAAQTGGTYNVAPTTSQLQGIYSTIAAAVSGQQTLLATTGSVQAGATDQKSVVVDSTIGEATFSISWANSASTIDLTLEDPNGNAINPAVAASNPDITYVSGSTYAYYRVKSPTLVYGVWKMMITGGTIPSAAQGINAPTAAENYSALVTGQVLGAAVTLNLYLDKLAYNVNEPIKVTATLSDDQPITGAEIIAIAGPIITAGPPSQAQAAANNPILILYDDGMHGDGAANDGVYANTLEGSNTANAGVYDFLVFTSGTDNDGEAFSRVVRQSVNVGLDENSFRSNLVEFAHTIYLPAALRP